MKKAFHIVLAVSMLAVACIDASGQSRGTRFPSFTYGVRWGLGETAFRMSDKIFICSEGYRYWDRKHGACLELDGFLEANVGLRFANRSQVALSSGLESLSIGQVVIPAELEYDWAPQGFSSDGWMLYGKAGAAFPIVRDLKKVDWLCGLGCGYRFVLSSRVSVEPRLGLRLAYDHPRVKDPDTGKYVNGRDIIRNDAFYSALCFSVGLNF